MTTMKTTPLPAANGDGTECGQRGPNRRAPIWLAGLAAAFALGIGPMAPRSRATDVPMTREGECLAVVEGIGLQTSFAHLPDGAILAFSLGTFHTSSDNGLTWSEPWKPKFEGKAPR